MREDAAMLRKVTDTPRMPIVRPRWPPIRPRQLRLSADVAEGKRVLQ